MSGFVHGEYLWLAALALAPLIIHFLFRLRPTVVRWPAMEILLAAMKKTRRRTRFEQLILLGLRMALAAVAAILIARPQMGDSLATLLESGQVADHVVVLDDTLSMGQTANGEAAFASAARSVARLADKLAERPGRSRLTLIATSRPNDVVFPTTLMDAEKAAAFRAVVEKRTPSFLATSPELAIDRAADLLASSEAMTRFLHVVGDMRQRDWPADGAALKALRKAGTAAVHLRLIDASAGPSDASPGNLGIEKLVVASAPIAVGIPIVLDASVRNHSERTVNDVSVEWRIDGKQTPRTVVKSIAPGAVVTSRLTTTFREPGSFAISAKLPADSLVADDERWAAISVVDRVPILVVDGDERQSEGKFIAAALDPGGDVQTGWAPTIRTLDAIRQRGLARFRSVLLVNVPSLTADDAKILTKYVSEGGSLCLFAGPQVSRDGWKPLENAELLPAVLGDVEPLPTKGQGDVDVSVAGPWSAKRFAFLDAVTVGRRFRIDGKLATDAEVLMTTRDRQPLAMSRRVGRGKTALVLTTAGPVWNDWATNPSFVVFQLELQSLLAKREGDESSRIGDKWSVPLDLTEYRRTASLKSGLKEVAISADSTAEGASLNTAAIDAPGVQRMTLQLQNGGNEALARAFNIDPAEGDLKTVATGTFARALEGTSFSLERVEAESEGPRSNNAEIRDLLIAILVALFVAEVAWARRCSRRFA